jgi:protein ImuB
MGFLRRRRRRFSPGDAVFAAIQIPSFYLQAALRYEPGLRDAAVAIVDEGEKPARVVEYTRAARRAGIREGMTSTQGLARCPGLEVRYRCAERERMAGVALLQCAGCASPYMEATGDGVCTLDWKGLPEGAFERTARELIRQLRGQELIAKIGIAATPGLALLAARNARNARPVLHVRRPKDLHGLGIRALGGSAEFERMLRRLGIRRVGQLSELPPEGIAARFGEEGLAQWECIAGRSTRLLKLVAAPEVFEEGTEFENEVELLEPLLFMLRRFLDCMAERLAAVYLVAAGLELRIGFTAGAEYVREFPIPCPTRDVETLFRMLFTHLEGFQSEHPIVSLHLTARPCKGVKEQLGLFETSLRDPNQFHQTLARLSALVGADRAGVPVKENTLRPDAFRVEAPAFHAAGRPRKTKGGRGLALRRFRPPRRAHVFTMKERPASLVMEDFSAPLGEASGPWVISGEWWDLHAWGRTEWEVESADGRLYRVFEQGDGWYIDGIYD